jgi:ATP-binding cassette subfamily B protein
MQARERVLLDGKDIRTYEPVERTKKIGFILQEPFLFTGTVRDNILYGNELYVNYSNEAAGKSNTGCKPGELAGYI